MNRKPRSAQHIRLASHQTQDAFHETLPFLSKDSMLITNDIFHCYCSLMDSDSREPTELSSSVHAKPFWYILATSIMSDCVSDRLDTREDVDIINVDSLFQHPLLSYQKPSGWISSIRSYFGYIVVPPFKSIWEAPMLDDGKIIQSSPIAEDLR